MRNGRATGRESLQEISRNQTPSYASLANFSSVESKTARDVPIFLTPQKEEIKGYGAPRRFGECISPESTDLFDEY